MARPKPQFTPAPEWWKHLRPYNKRRFWKKERKASDEDADRQAWEQDAHKLRSHWPI